VKIDIHWQNLERQELGRTRGHPDRWRDIVIEKPDVGQQQESEVLRKCFKSRGRDRPTIAGRRCGKLLVWKGR
jgi:hypothetical protein